MVSIKKWPLDSWKIFSPARAELQTVSHGLVVGEVARMDVRGTWFSVPLQPGHDALSRS